MLRTIAIIEPVGGSGGMNYYNLSLLFCIETYSSKVFLFTSRTDIKFTNKKILIFNFFDHCWLIENKFLKSVNYIINLFKSILKAKYNKCQVIHLHQFEFSFILIVNILITRIFFKKIILTVHDVESFRNNNYSSIFIKLVYKFISKFIVHNNFSYEIFYNKYKFQNIFIIPHGNYLKFFKPLDHNFKILPFKLLFFGQIKKNKGLDLLLFALSKVIIDNKNIQLTIVGKIVNNDLEHYQNLIFKYNLQEYIVTKFEYVSDEILVNYFNNCNLVVLPYKKIYQSGVLLKCLSLKRAVLCSDLPPFKEIIIDNYNGFLFSKNNVSSLSDKLLNIINTANDLYKIENNGFDLIKTKYNWDNLGFEYFKIYSNS